MASMQQRLPPSAAPPLSADRYAINRLELAGLEHMRMGELGEAERNLLEALERRGRAVPDEPDHPSLSVAVNNLGISMSTSQARGEAGFNARNITATLTGCR